MVLKPLAFVACIAVGGFAGYFLWQQRAEAQSNAAADPAVRVCEQRTKQTLLFPGSFEALSYEVGGTVASITYTANGLDTGLDSAVCVFARGPDGHLYLHDDPAGTQVPCSEMQRAASPECAGTEWAGPEYPLNPQTTALAVP